MERTQITDFRHLHVHLFVVGGNGEGESIVIIFKDALKVLFSMVVDSCQVVMGNEIVTLPQKILEKMGVKKLDCIAWTHPHDDHSKGLDVIVDQFYGKKTIGLIPKQLYGGDRNIVDISRICKEVLKRFNYKFKRKHLKFIDCQENETRPIMESVLQDLTTGTKKNVILSCMTPIDYLLDDKLRNGEKYSKSQLNELSLTLILNFDGYCFYFGGDAPDTTILKSNIDDLRDCRWVKIPHHGSKSNMETLGKLNGNMDAAVSSVYLSQGIPHEDVLNKYCEKAECVHVTQKARTDQCSYGMIEYDYDFSGASIKLEIKRYGNAYKYSGTLW